MGLIQRFFSWLDQRRDLKLERDLKRVKANDAVAEKALSALQDHTHLMRLWLEGFQRITIGEPFSSTVRDEDEVREELLRQEQGLPPTNVDRVNVPSPWEAEAVLRGLLKDMGNGN